MVDMATLQAVSYIIGSLGVLMAAVYYVLNLRETRARVRGSMGSLSPLSGLRE